MTENTGIKLTYSAVAVDQSLDLQLVQEHGHYQHQSLSLQEAVSALDDILHQFEDPLETVINVPNAYSRINVHT